MDCPGSCPTLIGVVDERADENRPDGLNRRPERQLGLLSQLRSDSEHTKDAFKSFPMIWSNDEWDFLKLSTIGTYRGLGKVFADYIGSSQKSSAVYV